MSKKVAQNGISNTKIDNTPETAQAHARRTREMLKKKGIKSPDPAKMLQLKKGSTIYCFYPENKDKYERMKKQLGL